MKNYQYLVFTKDQECLLFFQKHIRPLFNFLTASSTDSALNILEKNLIGTLIYDPQASNGKFDLIEKIRLKNIPIPIIALTKDFSLAKAVGAKAYIDPKSLLTPARQLH